MYRRQVFQSRKDYCRRSPDPRQKACGGGSAVSSDDRRPRNRVNCAARISWILVREGVASVKGLGWRRGGGWRKNNDRLIVVCRYRTSLDCIGDRRIAKLTDVSCGIGE